MTQPSDAVEDADARAEALQRRVAALTEAVATPSSPSPPMSFATR